MRERVRWVLGKPLPSAHSHRCAFLWPLGVTVPTGVALGVGLPSSEGSAPLLPPSALRPSQAHPRGLGHCFSPQGPHSEGSPVRQTGWAPVPQSHLCPHERNSCSPGSPREALLCPQALALRGLCGSESCPFGSCSNGCLVVTTCGRHPSLPSTQDDLMFLCLTLT